MTGFPLIKALLLGVVASAMWTTGPSVAKAEEAAESANNVLTPAEAADGWILLFDGKSLMGWAAEDKANEKDWVAKDGVITCSTQAGFNHLKSKGVFKDFILKLDFRVNTKGNSGIFIRGAMDGKRFVGPDGITGYEAQVDDNDPRGLKYTTGALYDKAEAKSLIKGENEWRSYEIVADGDHITTKINGQPMVDYRDSAYKVGHIGLQHHNPGSVIEFRNIKLKPLNLKPLFNGKDLSGWKVIDRDTGGKKTFKQEWKVEDGNLHVSVPKIPGAAPGGQGEIQTEAQFKDFVLQLDIRSNGKFLNSGVFFRALPGQVWQGYESQIRNQWFGERTNPIDYGTGGIYNLAKTKRVVPDDGQFFTKTIVAYGPYIGVWVNGEQVADLTDTRKPADNARNGAYTGPGAIGLQSHDPTTNLDFKNLKIADLDK
ncbi:MAG: DUF1080 domain-containing protein [Planctomycetota bacterium]